MAKKNKKIKKINQILSMVNLTFLAWVMLLMSILSLLNYTFIFIQIKFIHLGFIISFLGIISSILIFKKNKFGSMGGLIWSGSQIISFMMRDLVVNLVQFFDLSIKLGSISDQSQVIKINFLAIMLFYLFYIKRKEILMNQHPKAKT